MVIYIHRRLNVNVKIEISSKCGLCFGAKRALNQTIQALKEGKKVVLFKQLLHNATTMEKLYKLGAVEIQSLDKSQKGDLVVLRAHGEEKNTYKYLIDHKIDYLDCTCPNVLKIIELIREKEQEGYKIIIVGKHGQSEKQIHPEVKAEMGWCNNPILLERAEEIDSINFNKERYFLVVQTTFSSKMAEKIIDLLRKKISKDKIFIYKNTTCKAQHLIKTQSLELAKRVDIMLVIGDKKSSNTTELYKALSNTKQTFFIENTKDVLNLIENNKIYDGMTIGITAGASTSCDEIERIKNSILEN